MGADLYQKIFIDKDKNFSAKMGYDKTLGSMYPEKFLISDGDDYRVTRRLYQTAFKNDAMRRYIGDMNAVVAQHIEKLKAKQDILFLKILKVP